jgi:hypothetical protein
MSKRVADLLPETLQLAGVKTCRRGLCGGGRSVAHRMARWHSGFPIVARLRRELFKAFARSVWPVSRDRNAVGPRIRNRFQLTPIAPGVLPAPRCRVRMRPAPSLGRPHPICRGSYAPRCLGTRT